MLWNHILSISQCMLIRANSAEFPIKVMNLASFYDFTNVVSSFTKNNFCLRKKLKDGLAAPTTEYRAKAHFLCDASMQRLQLVGLVAVHPRWQHAWHACANLSFFGSFNALNCLLYCCSHNCLVTSSTMVDSRCLCCRACCSRRLARQISSSDISDDDPYSLFIFI